ncbi:MAG: hypothetical protein KVP17_004806 [Porospora cf. gigantea B]|uniref:uncharacterized protein n=1 Tax=Porospora cf. gigantea B TaxID=2853592 RepID=UPI003571D771|nr:MAG: hypothetical protein KVP17_004806 [Porospora cf. gigantea B]
MASQEEIPLLPIAGKSLEVDVGGIDPNLTLRVLEPKTFRHLDDILNSCPAVETKRRHFKHTREFADSGGGLVFVEQPDLIQDFDCCFVFPSDLSEESDGMCQTKTKIYSDLEVREKLMRICTARDVNDTNKGRIERSDIASALPFYELHRYVGSPRTESEFRNIVFEIFVRCLANVLQCEMQFIHNRPEEKRYVKVRLTERGAMALAEGCEYPLRMTRFVTEFDEYRKDHDFDPPNMSYENTLERDAKLQCVRRCGRVFTRYDRLSQPVETEQLNTKDKELSMFRDVDRVRLLRLGVLQIFNLHEMEEQGLFECWYMLHQPLLLQHLKSQWSQFPEVYHTWQPIKEIRDYFGEEIALYFAWLGHYTRMLWVPAMLGVLTSGLQWRFDPQLQFTHPGMTWIRVGFSAFMAGWCSFMVCTWQQKEQAYRWQWGMVQQKALLCERSAFKFDRWIRDPCHPSKFVKYYSPWKSHARRFVSSLVAAVCVLMCVVIINGDLHEHLLAFYGFMDPVSQFVDSIPGVGVYIPVEALITAILVQVFDKFFMSISESLIEFENHPYEHEHRDSLIFKYFTFTGMDYFSPLFYLAFIKTYLEPCSEGSSDVVCMGLIREQLLTLFIVDMGLNVLELGLPWFQMWWNQQELSPEDFDDDALLEHTREPYESTMEDYIEMITQLTLVTLFSMVWPIVPFLALVANHVEIRVDAVKLTRFARRPFPRAATSIGAWNFILEFVSLLTILSNSALCVFSLGNHLPMWKKLALTLAFVGVSFCLREALKSYIPPESANSTLKRHQQAFVFQEAVYGRNKYRSLTDRSSIDEKI